MRSPTAADCLLIWILMWPFRKPLDHTDKDSEFDRKRRQRVLGIGYWASSVSLSLWLTCGILFPLGLHFQMGEAVLKDYVHFFASHVINGSLAAAAIFFLVSDFALEQLFPKIVKLKSTDPESKRTLQRLDKGHPFDPRRHNLPATRVRITCVHVDAQEPGSVRSIGNAGD